MPGLATKEVETHLSRESINSLISNPFFLASAVGHFWIWGVYDKTFNEYRALSRVVDPDFSKMKGVFIFGVEGEKLYLVDVDINGPTLAGSGVRYEVTTLDGKVKVVFGFFVQRSAAGNKLLATIETNESVEKTSSFFSFFGGQKYNVKNLAQHLLEDHFTPFITKYLEPREPTTPKLRLNPAITEEGEVKELLPKLSEVAKKVGDGYAVVTGNDFTFIVTIENGECKNMVYRDGNTTAVGPTALGMAFMKSGRVVAKVYNVNVGDVILSLVLENAKG